MRSLRGIGTYGRIPFSHFIFIYICTSSIFYFVFFIHWWPPFSLVSSKFWFLFSSQHQGGANVFGRKYDSIFFLIFHLDVGHITYILIKHTIVSLLITNIIAFCLNHEKKWTKLPRLFDKKTFLLHLRYYVQYLLKESKKPPKKSMKYFLIFKVL